MKQRISRRSVLRRIGAAGAGIVVLENASSAWSAQANEKVATAYVGVGGRGRELLTFAFANQARPVAFCDVNDNKAMEMYRKFPDLPKFKDYRQLLDKMGRQIDGVVVATPDHTHAIISAAAIRAGKHVYTEKPLSRLVQESRVLRALAREHKVATSMGNQGTASNQFRRAIELIRGGTIGAIREIHVWNNMGGAGQSKPPDGEEKIPPYVDWDLWLGPAKMRPFNIRWMAWSQWRDFGTSQLGNWASHTANLAFMSMKVDTLWYADPLTKPIIRVEANRDQLNKLSFPRWEHVTWHIPARAELPPIDFNWYNGDRMPGMRDKLEALVGRGLDWGDKGEKKWADFAGCIIIGTEGRLHSTGHNATFNLYPEDKFREVRKEPPQQLDRSLGHEADWLNACRGGKTPRANYDYAGPLNEFLQLGNVVTQVDAPIEYDPLAGRIVNDANADKLLSAEYRDGWSL